MKVGLGLDAHRFAPDRPLLLGGVRIRERDGLAGHSDADVLAHAVMDAMLGASGREDIGYYFPDTDPVWQVGMWCSLRPADRSHPQGHRGVEPLISLLIGISIAIVAIQVFVRGIRGLSEPPEIVYTVAAVVVLLVTMAVKAGIAIMARRSAGEISAPALRAAGDDATADIMASGLALSGYLASWLGFGIADPVFSIVVAGFVGRTAFEVLRENTGYILGKSAPAEIEEKVMAVACAPDMVCAVHDLRVYHVGPELHVSFHVEIDKHATLEDVHDLEQDVRLSLLDLPEVDNVTLHVDPVPN